MILLSSIKKCLPKFLDSPDQGFDDLFEKLQDAQKEKARLVLVYLDKVLNRTLDQPDALLNYSHIHFDRLDIIYRDVIAEFIILKLFFRAFEQDAACSPYIETQIAKANRILNAPVHLPIGVKLGSRRKKGIKEDRSIQRDRKAFFEALANTKEVATLLPRTIFNILSRQEMTLEALFGARPFCIHIDKLLSNETSYVVTNTDRSRDSIDEISDGEGNALLDRIENIVLFDCEERQLHRQWNFTELKQWKEKFNSAFRNLLILSFNDTAEGFNGLKAQVERVQMRFHSIPEFPNYGCYIITHDELEHLLGGAAQHVSIKFHGQDHCTFWDDLRSILHQYEGLYELQSIKMMNVYALGFNEALRNLIIADLFGKQGASCFLTKDTKDVLMELSDDTLNELKLTLMHVLKWFKEIGWSPRRFIENVPGKPLILIPQVVKKHPYFLAELFNALANSNRRSYISWADIDDADAKEVFCLDYRDFGSYPYQLFPNAFLPGVNTGKFHSVFLAALFKQRAQWSLYNYSKDLMRLIGHPIRVKEMDWNNIIRTCMLNRPEAKDDVDWSEEKNYQSEYDVATIKVRFKNGAKRTFVSSEPCIYRLASSTTLKVDRIENLAGLSTYQKDMDLQRLEDLYANFNIYERIANKEREETELKVIRANLGIGANEPPRKLWKVILKRKVDKDTAPVVYSEIKELLTQNGLGMVSFDTFVNCWIDPQNESLLPRGTKIFRTLCEFLQLPRSYFRIMLRLKNVEIQSSRKSSKQMDDLLSDLINDGCFTGDHCQILTQQRKKYISKHNFEEIGIPDDAVITELAALVELLRPLIDLQSIDTIETNSL